MNFIAIILSLALSFLMLYVWINDKVKILTLISKTILIFIISYFVMDLVISHFDLYIIFCCLAFILIFIGGLNNKNKVKAG